MLLGNPSVVKSADALSCENGASAQLAGCIMDPPSHRPPHWCRQTSVNDLFWFSASRSAAEAYIRLPGRPLFENQPPLGR